MSSLTLLEAIMFLTFVVDNVIIGFFFLFDQLTIALAKRNVKLVVDH
jgi:uncharacterized membrane protein YciS (DUF1049 family)